MIRVESSPPLTEVRAKLRAAGGGFPKALQKVNKTVAEKVAEEARSAYSRRYHRISGAGERSIRALATQTKAQVAVGSDRVPYTAAQNFGSNKIARFAPKADPDKFLYASVEKRRTWIEQEHGEMVDDLMHEAFPEGSHG